VFRQVNVGGAFWTVREDTCKIRGGVFTAKKSISSADFIPQILISPHGARDGI
jgi:hypothetical protein